MLLFSETSLQSLENRWRLRLTTSVISCCQHQWNRRSCWRHFKLSTSCTPCDRHFRGYAHLPHVLVALVLLQLLLFAVSTYCHVPVHSTAVPRIRRHRQRHCQAGLHWPGSGHHRRRRPRGCCPTDPPRCREHGQLSTLLQEPLAPRHRRCYLPARAKPAVGLWLYTVSQKTLTFLVFNNSVKC